ncbi:MAG: hypothetical protein NVS2B7_37320 [Herpetosiphon sp.]
MQSPLAAHQPFVTLVFALDRRCLLTQHASFSPTMCAATASWLSGSTVIMARSRDLAPPPVAALF